MSELKVVSLEECLEKVIDYRGRTPKKLGKDWVKNGEYRAISANNVKFDGLIREESIYRGDEELYKLWMKEEVEKGDILLTSEAPSGQAMIWDSDEKIILSQRLYALRVNKNLVDNSYLKYFIQSPLGQKSITRNNSGSTVSGISAKTFKNIKILIPDLENQQAISKFLLTIDQKIQINNQINQELEAMAKTLYDYWFVQFDFPDQNGKPYKSSGGKMVYNPELKREIPDGWGVESVVDNTLSKVIKPGIDHFTQKTYLATGDVVNTSIKDGRLITFENRETRANMQPSVNSVWFAKMKSSNKHLFLSHSMKELIDSTILSTGFMGLQCKEESFEYIASFISDPNFEIFKDTLSHGATQEAVNIDDLRSVPVIIPDDYILREFHRIAKSIFLNLGRNMIEDKTLSSLRDWLLPMLMNGQVKVE